MRIFICVLFLVILSGCNALSSWTYNAKKFDGETWIRATDVANYMALKQESKETVDNFIAYCNLIESPK